MEKSQKILERLNKQIEKLKNLIAQIRGILETITTFLDIISTAIDIAKTLVIGFDAALAGQTVPHINGLTVNKLGDLKLGAKKKIEKYSLVIKGINFLIKIIIPLLEAFERQLAGIEGAYNGVKSLMEASGGMMDDCLGENLVTQIGSSELTEGVALEGLVDIYNSSGVRLVKIRKYETNPLSETKEYTIKTIPSEEFKN